VARHGGQQETQNDPQDGVVDPGDAQREMADAATKQSHLVQQRSEHRQRRHPDTDAECHGELQGVIPGASSSGWRARIQSPPAQPRAVGTTIGEGDSRNGSTIAAEGLGVEVQPGNQPEYQHRDRADTRQRRQRRRIDKQLVIFRSYASE
jgi:hypothetical protein